MKRSLLPRRLRRYGLSVLWVSLASTAPVAVLLAVSYSRTLANAEAQLAATVLRAHQEFELLVDEAEGALTRIAESLDKGPAVLDAALIRVIYDSPFFREAGVLDSRSRLVRTNQGAVSPPHPVEPGQRSDPSVRSVQVIGPTRTTVMRERSIIFAMPTRDGGEVNLLLDPDLLLYLVDPVDAVSLGPDGYVAFVADDGTVIAIDGARPAGEALLADPPEDRIRRTRYVEGQGTTIVGEFSRAWVLRTWSQIARVAAPVTFAGVLAIASLFVVLFRRTETLDHEIRSALDGDEFELHYQPIVRLDTGECIGSEALIRWRHPDEGMLLPALFVPAAEKTGLISALGEWVVQEAVREQGGLIERRPDLYLSINVSPAQLNSGAIDAMIRWLDTASFPRDRIVFEITEATILRELETTALDSIARLRALGSQVGLDDFGTGYSSLSYAHRLEFDFLKIDQQFIRGIDTDVRTNSILEAMVELGRALDVRIVAEGVESERQRAFLLELGVELAQGWLFSRPLPFEEYERELAKEGEPPKS